MKQYSANLSKGKEIIEYYINELANEGITSVPIWTEPASAALKSPESELATTTTTSAAAATISVSDDPSLIAARRRLSSQDTSNIFTPSSPPKASGVTPTAAANFSALSDDLETLQVDESSQEKRRTYSLNPKVSCFHSILVGNIDDEYIRRYIGQLDPFEESCLVQLRKWVAETHKGKVNNNFATIDMKFFSLILVFSYRIIHIYFGFFVLDVLISKKQEKVFAIP